MSLVQGEVYTSSRSVINNNTKSSKTCKRQICLRDLSNQREVKMPDSPVLKLSMLSHSTSPQSPVTNEISPSSSSAKQHLNSGCSSPPQSREEDDNSSAALSSQNDPGSSSTLGSAQQLSKLKRFLTTLQQFGSDISPEIGERVRTLVLALVNSHLSIEDFHTKLQEATNFPLRPFVVPFLKANLPLLQRELLQYSPLSGPSILGYRNSVPNSYLQSCPKDLTLTEINGNGKRPLPDRTKENGVDFPPVKRQHNSSSSSSSSTMSPVLTTRLTSLVGGQRVNGGVGLSDDITLAQELLNREHADKEPKQERTEHDHIGRLNSYGYIPTHNNYQSHLLQSEQEDWQIVESLLNNIVMLVDRCKRVLESLEERNRHWREDAAASFLHLHPKVLDLDLRRCHTHLSPNFGHNGDRLAQVHRRTEGAIQEVRMQAVLELQKAVAAAEVKANHIVAAERAKMELAVLEARKQAQEEILVVLGHQEKSAENCWNCGRKANETCSGCHNARYCGSYCQHKDWENHHRVCGNKISSSSLSVSLSPGKRGEGKQTLEGGGCELSATELENDDRHPKTFSGTQAPPLPDKTTVTDDNSDSTDCHPVVQKDAGSGGDDVKKE